MLSGRSDGVRAMAGARVAVGTALVVAPGLVLRPWVGAEASRRPVPRLLARAMGGRDLAIGLGGLLAASHGAPVRGWIEAGMVCDVGDALATALAARHLPRAGAVAGILAALGTAAAGRRIVAALEGDPAPGT